MRSDISKHGCEGLSKMFDALVKKVGEGSGYLKSWSITSGGIFSLQMSKMCNVHIPVIDPLNIGPGEPSTGSVFMFGDQSGNSSVIEVHNPLSFLLVHFIQE